MSHVTLEQARRKRQEEVEKLKQEEALKKQQVCVLWRHSMCERRYAGRVRCVRARERESGE